MIFIIVSFDIMAQLNYGINPYSGTNSYSSALGNNNSVGCLFCNTWGSFASGYSNAILNQANASHVFGDNCKVGGFASLAIGHKAEAINTNSFAIGRYIKATNALSFVIGTGFSNTYLANNISNSLMIGFNSTVPTLFVGPANGANTIGTVMIGTTSLGNAAGQGYLLGVKGGIIAEKVKVATYDNWADYVFDETYPLKTLEEVETFINTYSCLPDMPNALDIKNNGYDLAEMDALLLKKIEELYLYVIELKKENEELKKQILK